MKNIRKTWKSWIIVTEIKEKEKEKWVRFYQAESKISKGYISGQLIPIKNWTVLDRLRLEHTKR